MDFVEWDQKYSVNIKEIDNQHKKLINLANELFKACLIGKEFAEKEFKNVIKEAVDYVKVHFKFEEELLFKYNYPEFKQHKQEHEDFVRKILEDVKNFESGKNFVPNNFARFLRDWTLQHIAVSDKKYSAFLKSKGVQ
ncbi:MAG TPA: bacteriohemerythrin [Spirochaetota bacterium]|mgnify:CR=1 FL=1|nr:bacteriohemerythrin [Spirochaetota bacterium]HPP05701.1 bacteriohemerythrin [Spirochaetota bacterium]